jgi:hypothetical protein
MPERPFLVQSVMIGENGLVIDYTRPAEDVKSNGLQVTHSLFIPLGEDYDDEIEAVLEAVHDCLADAHEDLELLGGPKPRFRRQPDDADTDETDTAATSAPGAETL